MIKEKIIVNLAQLINIQIELEQNIAKIVLQENILKQQEILNVNYVKRVLVEKIMGILVNLLLLNLVNV